MKNQKNLIVKINQPIEVAFRNLKKEKFLPARHIKNNKFTTFFFKKENELFTVQISLDSRKVVKYSHCDLSSKRFLNTFEKRQKDTLEIPIKSLKLATKSVKLATKSVKPTAEAVNVKMDSLKLAIKEMKN